MNLVAEKLAVVEITERAARVIESGGLWIFSNEILRKSPDLKSGSWCWFESKTGFVGAGYMNPHSLISGRIVSREKTDDIAGILKKGIENAFARRNDLSFEESGRLIFSEGDFIPGLVLDYFSGVLVLQSNTAGIDAALPLLEELIPSSFKKIFGRDPSGFIIRADSGIRRLESVSDFSKIVSGEETALKNASFKADGVSYAADFLEGQKTGFFLDQRDNRRFFSNIIKNSPKPNVADLFCYSGGWGLAGLAAGASHVTFVDESPKALQLVKRGLELNGLSPDRAEPVKSDVFDFLEKESRFYDIVVADPPAFVKSKKNLSQARRAYEKLNRLAWKRLKPGGILFGSSCSYHLSESDFLENLQAAVAKEKGLAHVVYRGGQASDHPILLSMPETKYLKCIGLKKIN